MSETSSRVLFIPLGAQSHQHLPTVSEAPKTLERRAYSENEATITAGKEMAGNLKQAVLDASSETGHKSMVDLHKSVSPSWKPPKPSTSRVGDASRSFSGPPRRQSLEEGGLVRSLPRPPSRHHLRPLADLGVQMSLSREPSTRSNSFGTVSEAGGEIREARVEDDDDLEAIIVDTGEELFEEKKR
jgi:hypothetical protein